MFRNFSKPFSFFFSLLLLMSCGSTKYTASNDLAPLNSGVNIAKYEVSVGDWITYLVSTCFVEEHEAIHLGDHMDAIQSKFPDTTLNGWSTYAMKAFLRKSQKHVSVKFYNECKNQLVALMVAESAWDTIRKNNMMSLPIVGITYDQAMEYIGYKEDLSNSCLINDKSNYRYECFLPSPKQFMVVQTALDSVNYQGCNLYNYKDSSCENCPNAKKYKDHLILRQVGKAPGYVWSYFPDNSGLYNFKGNVSEMTSVEGIAMGGSFKHYASEAFGERFQEYAGSAEWLGFRVWYRKLPKGGAAQ